MATLYYLASSQKAVFGEPLDIDSALDYGFDYQDWLQTLETLAELDVELSDTTIATLGDGATGFTTKAGAVTPAAPAINGTMACAWVYAVQATASDNVGKTFELDFTVRTNQGRVDSRSIKIMLAER